MGNWEVSENLSPTVRKAFIKPQLHAVNGNDWLGSNQSVVFIVTINPNPDEVFTIFYGEAR
jgi:hypothetical protein